MSSITISDLKNSHIEMTEVLSDEALKSISGGDLTFEDVFSGAFNGAVIGSTAGPKGMIAGAVVGGILGALK